ncbi:MAG: TolC family protein [bacterium]|jgi:outer membrane protein|nr:TolC family protein [bacterium]
MKPSFFTVLFLACSLTLPAGAQSPVNLTLAESLLRAQKNNESLLIAEQDLETARFRILESLADGLPQLDAGLAYDRNWLLPNFVFGNQSVTIGAHNNLSGKLGFRQSLYSGGKLFASVRVARLYRQYAHENIRLIQQRVHSAAESAFYDLLYARDLVALSKLSLIRAQANQDQVLRLFESGRVSEYDLLRAQTQVAEIRPDSIRASNQFALAALALKNALGLDSETNIEITGNFRSESPVVGGSEREHIARGLLFRPEIRQQAALIAMRKNAETVTRSGGRPKLELVVNGQWEAQKDNFGFTGQDFHQSWFSGLSLDVPLFDGFRTRAQVSQARIDTRRAELELRQTERAIRLEIARAHQVLEESLAQEQAQGQVQILALRGLKIAETRYLDGIGTQLEVIDGQLTVQRAEASLARARHDVAVAIVMLERSMGILGNDVDTNP